MAASKSALLTLAEGASHGAVDGSYLVWFSKGPPREFEAAVEALGGSVTRSHGAGLAWVAGLDDGAAETLRKQEGVREVLPDVAFSVAPRLVPGRAEAAAASPESPSDPTTAIFYGSQWDLRAIHADDAWAAGRLGSSRVTVAILDTGIDYQHPDLAGLVDLDRSVSFVGSDDDLVDTYFPGSHPVTDLHYHGTHVAATVASNAIGAAGVTSRTTLMGVKVCDVTGSCSLVSTIAGLLYAADNGADVINLSLGGLAARRDMRRWVGLINSLFNYVGSKGVTIVVSAGNDAIDLDHLPNGYKTYCSAPNAICVSATGPAEVASGEGSAPEIDVDAPASYTNFGRSAINVAAPGGTPLGNIVAACSGTSLQISACRDRGYIWVVGLWGTSMAAPHVSGLAALVVEDVGRNPGRVKTVIQRSADDLGQRGVDPYYGKGRINVYGAVRQ